MQSDCGNKDGMIHSEDAVEHHLEVEEASQKEKTSPRH